MRNSRSLATSFADLVALCMACGALSAARAQAAAPARPASSAVSLTIPATAPVVPDQSLDSPPTAADANATELCRSVHFTAYSTLSDGRKVQESFIWNSRSKSYLVRGPLLAMMLDDPGISEIPSDAAARRTLFRVAVRAQLSRPVNRFCQYHFQEMANCDAHGDIIYTQIYTDCDLQTLRHVVMITPDHAGTLPLLALRFQDVRGIYSDPVLYLAADSDLRTSGRSAR